MHQYAYSPHTYEFTATVTKLTRQKDAYEIELSESYFFPEAGGQPADRGTIDGKQVVTVKDTHPIVHVLREELQIGQSVSCVIDNQYRLENSRQHTGQHILSAVASRLFQAQSESFKIGDGWNSIELHQKLTREQLDQIEQETNAIILNNLTIESQIYTDTNLIPATLRKNHDFVPLRVVTIPDVDECACCGTHADRTGQLGLCTILKAENISKGVKIQFAFGKRAFEALNLKKQLVDSLCDHFTCGPELLKQSIEAVQNQLKLTNKKYTDLSKATFPTIVADKATIISEQTAFLKVDFLIQNQEANSLLQLLSKKYKRSLVCFNEVPNESQIILLDADKTADLLQQKIQQIFGDKITKQGGNQQRKQITITGKVQSDQLIKILQ